MENYWIHIDSNDVVSSKDIFNILCGMTFHCNDFYVDCKDGHFKKAIQFSPDGVYVETDLGKSLYGYDELKEHMLPMIAEEIVNSIVNQYGVDNYKNKRESLGLPMLKWFAN